MNIIKQVFLYLLIGGLYVGGLAHSFGKHGAGDGIASIIIPPWAIYRSAEMFWHNDFAGVNWDKQLHSDMEKCIYLIDESIDKDRDEYILNSEIEEISKKISNYPSDKTRILIGAMDCYLRLHQSLLEDADRNRFTSSENFSFSYSVTTNNILNKLSSDYGLKDHVEKIKNDLKAITDATIAKVREHPEIFYPISEDERKQVEQNNLQFRRQMKKTFDKIFYGA